MMSDRSLGLGRLLRATAVFSVLVSLPAIAVAQDAAPKIDPDTVIATVNGKTLTERELQIALSEIAPGTTLDDQKRDQIIGFLVNVKLVAKAAEDAKIGEGPDFAAHLEFLREKALMQIYLEKIGREAVTEDAVKKLYEDTVKGVKPEQEVRARHILVESEDDAKAVVARLTKGDDFEALAKELSKDPGSGEQGGDLGYFSKEQMVPEFSEAAFKLDAGKVSEPVKSQFGWHIIKVEDKRERPVPTLEEVRPQVEDYLQKRAQEEAVKKLVEGAKIERTGTGDKAKETGAPAAK